MWLGRTLVSDLPDTLARQIADLEARLAHPLPDLSRQLVEQQIAALRQQQRATLIDLSGAQMGDMTIGDVAGCDVVKGTKGTADVGGPMQGAAVGVNQGTIQIFFGVQSPAPVSPLAAVATAEQIAAQHDLLDAHRATLRTLREKSHEEMLHGVPQQRLRYHLKREEEIIELRKILKAGENIYSTQTIAPNIVCVHGMGGVGKSVIVAELCHDEGVQEVFPDGIYWLSFGEDVIIQERQKQLAIMLGQSSLNISDVIVGKALLGELLRGKQCMLVLDDVRSTEQLDAFDMLRSSSRIVLTTRNKDIVRTFGSTEQYEVNFLSEEQSLRLLAEWAEQDRDRLPVEAVQVVRECGQLPLALTMIGSMLRGRPNRWKSVLALLQESHLDKISESLFPNYRYKKLVSALQMSVDDLDLNTRERYLELAVFPEDAQIPIATLIAFWKSRGLEEDSVLDVVDTLVNRSLIRIITEERLILHDLQRDYLIYVNRRDGHLQILHNQLLSAYWAECDRDVGWASGPEDGYFYQNLAYHLKRADREDELIDLLTGTPAWMERKFKIYLGASSYMTDLEFALADLKDPLDIVSLHYCVRLHAARHAVNQWASQYVDDDIKVLVWLGRDAEAQSHARLRSRADERFNALLIVYDELQKN